MFRHFKLSLAAMVMLGIGAAVVQAGKPVKPPLPPLPPVRYQVQFWTVPAVTGNVYLGDVYDTNSALQTVGSCWIDTNGDGYTDETHAYLYDPIQDADFAVDLNSVVLGIPVVSGIPAGWSIRKATAINENRQIVAYIEPIAAPLTKLQPVMIDMNQTPWTMYELPDRSFTDYSLPGDINDSGDIVVRYQRNDETFGHYVFNFDPLFSFNFDPSTGDPSPLDLGIVTSLGNHPRINNVREIVGTEGSVDGYRLTLGGPLERFAGLLPFSLNEDGAFCGVATVKRANYGFVYSTSLELISGLGGARDLNMSRDVVNAQYLYHPTYGRLSVKDLLDPVDPDSSRIVLSGDLHCQTMTDRMLGTNFPVLTGSYQGIGVQFLPVPAP